MGHGSPGGQRKGARSASAGAPQYAGGSWRSGTPEVPAGPRRFFPRGRQSGEEEASRRCSPSQPAAQQSLAKSRSRSPVAAGAQGAHSERERKAGLAKPPHIQPGGSAPRPGPRWGAPGFRTSWARHAGTRAGGGGSGRKARLTRIRAAAGSRAEARAEGRRSAPRGARPCRTVGLAELQQVQPATCS